MTRICIMRRTMSGILWDSLFGETKRLICEQSEILDPKTPEIVGRGERFRRTQITKSSCACHCGRRPVSVSAFEIQIFFEKKRCFREGLGSGPGKRREEMKNEKNTNFFKKKTKNGKNENEKMKFCF